MTEMRSKKLGPRYYQPWDPLQLSVEITGPHLALKNKIMFTLYRSFKKKLRLSPLVSKNMALFAAPEEVEELLSSFCKQAVRRAFHEALTIEVYRFPHSTPLPSLSSLDDTYYFLREHPYEASLAHFLGEMDEHASFIREECTRRGLSEPPHKRLQLIVLLLGPEEVKELEQVEVAELFSSLMTTYDCQRILPLVIAEDASHFPPELLPSLDIAFFLGEANESYAKEIGYPQLPLGCSSFVQVEVGVGFHHVFPEELLVCHPLIFTPSPWKLERDAAEEEEERIYQEYLTALRKEAR